VGDDAQALQRIVDANKEAFDYEFFLTIAAYIEAAEQEHDEESLRLFTELRDRLIEMTGFQGDVAGSDESDTSEAVDKLLSAEESALPTLLGEYRHAIDYAFYEAFSERIDAAHNAGDGAEAARLEARRDLIRNTVEQMDRETQALFESAAQTLQEALESDDPRAVLTAHRDELGEAFLFVVSANAQQAERRGDTALANRLAEIQRMAVEVVQESLTPEERLIGQLLGAEKPQDATKLLRQNAALINADFVKRLNEMSGEMEQAGRKELGDRLKQLGREAASMLF
jgi:hypothetical protein